MLKNKKTKTNEQTKSTYHFKIYNLDFNKHFD